MTLIIGSRQVARLVVPAIVMIVVVGAVPAMADDWPTYRHDSSRSGLAESGPEAPMPQRWVFEPQAPPTQAWAGPRDEPVEGNWEQHRVDYDAANHIVAVGDRVFLGSSGDSRVYCLDAATGRPVWSYICGAPVRLAPSVHDGRVYFGSDDGHAYCVSAEDGSLIWRVAAGPDDAMCIGNERMISRWPIRTDVLIDGGVAYFGAGIFPHEGVYVSALDATTGEVIWRNDVLSQGSAGRNGFSPQGYILAPLSTARPGVRFSSPATVGVPAESSAARTRFCTASTSWSARIRRSRIRRTPVAAASRGSRPAGWSSARKRPGCPLRPRCNR
jgi:hypothetical protein